MRPRFIFAGLFAAIHDFIGALDAHASAPLARLLPRLAAGLVLALFLYVPLHELMHAAGCALLGGSVEVIEISPLFGGNLLARVWPAVSPATKYAGRLAKFDVGGSDLVFLGTDFAPYLLTILVGVPLLRALRGEPNPWLLGPASVLAMAPWISLTGDYYEIGSILVTRLLGLTAADWSALRSDDMIALLRAVWITPGNLDLPPAAGPLLSSGVIAISFLVGVILASFTYWLGTGIATSISAAGKGGGSSADPLPG